MATFFIQVAAIPECAQVARFRPQLVPMGSPRCLLDSNPLFGDCDLIAVHYLTREGLHVCSAARFRCPGNDGGCKIGGIGEKIRCRGIVCRFFFNLPAEVVCRFNQEYSILLCPRLLRQLNGTVIH